MKTISSRRFAQKIDDASLNNEKASSPSQAAAYRRGMFIVIEDGSRHQVRGRNTDGLWYGEEEKPAEQQAQRLVSVEKRHEPWRYGVAAAAPSRGGAEEGDMSAAS